LSSPLIIYDSGTGKVKLFVRKLGLNALFLRNIEKVNEPFVLVTYTAGYGEMPESTERFLNDNHQFLLAVSASGNRRWKDFAGAADRVFEKFGVPIISKFEGAGNINDVKTFIEGIGHFDNSSNGNYGLLRA